MTKEKSACGCHITDGQISQCPVCESGVYSLNFWDRVWFLVSVTSSAAGSVLRAKSDVGCRSGPPRVVAGLTVNTSAGSHWLWADLCSPGGEISRAGSGAGRGRREGVIQLVARQTLRSESLCVNHEDDICYRVPKLWTQLPQCNLH